MSGGIRLDSRVYALEHAVMRFMSEQTPAQRASWTDEDRSVLATPTHTPASSESDGDVPRAHGSAARAPTVLCVCACVCVCVPDQELQDALCEHHGYLVGGDGRPYPLSAEAVQRNLQWERIKDSGSAKGARFHHFFSS